MHGDYASGNVFLCMVFILDEEPLPPVCSRRSFSIHIKFRAFFLRLDEAALSLALKTWFTRVAAVFSLLQAALIAAQAAPSPTTKEGNSHASGLQPSGKAAVHWAFVAPQRPPLPQADNRRWLRNPI